MSVSTFLAAFGARASGERLARMKRSPQYRDGKFHNSVPTNQVLPGQMWKTLRHQVTGTEQRVPPGPLPVVSRTPADFAAAPASGLRVTWFGHATTLIEIDGHRILVTGRRRHARRGGGNRLLQSAH